MATRSNTIRILSSKMLSERFSMADVVRWVSDGYLATANGSVAETTRVQLGHPAARTRLNVMPAGSLDSQRIGVHLYTGGNRGASAVRKVTALFRLDDGGLDTVIESDWLSWARTGASGAVASALLARPDSSVLGIFGSGKQAHAQVAAIQSNHELSELVCYSRDERSRYAFASAMADRYGLSARAAADPAEILDVADIISTATTSTTPVFDGHQVRPGTHVNAIGQHYQDRRELDSDIVSRAKVFVDTRERSLSEDGEIAMPMAAGLIGPDHLLGTLGEIMTGAVDGRTSVEDITIFTSGGTSAEYLAVAGQIARIADAEDLGTLVDLDPDWEFA